ncbi:hypothetical protein LVB87_14410 [Lysobacter sp. KIS68-7]|uniref:hypothetical protein n=1 Tax=Lysobacter sp. KIS68-7 TaxID=2904252 RepID=UPI001E5451C8|nr:hypothetical protein [Lysobacter sp. KIS68-7]UHQ19360.1 hypothetical protein LVB87_14410 [Lysobacter sp. KIS68-7]
MSIKIPPSWFDAKIDYTHPRFHEALAFGRAAARNANWEWDRAETSLMEVWSSSPRQGKWWDVRGAVFYAWDEERLSFSAKDEDDEWSDGVAGL